jgi:hypothetical protein
MVFLTDSDSEQLVGGFGFPSVPNVFLAINISPSTVVKPITQLNTVVNTGVAAGILQNVSLKFGNSPLNFAIA